MGPRHASGICILPALPPMPGWSPQEARPPGPLPQELPPSLLPSARPLALVCPWCGSSASLCLALDQPEALAFLWVQGSGELLLPKCLLG